MEYLVLQSFVSHDIVGTKNKTIIIQDEEFAESLIDANIIAKIGNKKTNKEKDKEIAELNNAISLLKEENNTLKAENEELVEKINSLEKISNEDEELENESSKENLETEQVNDNLDDKSILNTESN